MTDKPIKATLDSSNDSVKTQKPILIQLDDIPTPEAGDAGKVLGVDSEGKYTLTEGGGGGDFSSIRGKNIELTVTNNVLSAVEIDDVSVTPSDFVNMPYVDIVLTLSYVHIFGVRVFDEPVNNISFDNGTANLNEEQLWIGGLYTYETPDGAGLGSGSLLITREGLEVNFDAGNIFVSP